MTNDRWTGVNHTCAFHNNKPIKTRSCDTLSSAYVTCSNSDFMSPSQLVKFTSVRKEVTYVQYGGSCFAYGVLASGRSDLAIDAGLDAFDIYACAAIIQGAGGIVTSWDGAELSFDMDGTVLAAGDKSLYQKVIKQMVVLSD
jgi:fructose-1,6-bisphosphatase/inositol monophosphatase family enzyme